MRANNPAETMQLGLDLRLSSINLPLIMRIPPHKKKPDPEGDVQKLSADGLNIHDEGDEAWQSTDSEGRYQKKGRFYKTLQPSKKSPTSDTADRSENEQAMPKPSAQLAWMTGNFSTQLTGKPDNDLNPSTMDVANERIEGLISRLEQFEAYQRLHPDEASDKVPIKISEQELQAARSARRAKLKLNSTSPKLSQILDKEEHQPRDIETGWEAERAVAPVGWFVVLGIFIGAVGGWAIYDVMNARNVTDETALEKRLLGDARNKENEEVRDLLADMQDCVKGYLAAGSVDDMLAFVRHSERVGPLMDEYYKTHKRWRRRFDRFEHIRAVSMGTKSIVYVMAETKMGSKKNLFLEQLDDGSYRVDWESDVIYQPMPWQEYLTKRPLAPLDMRVKVQTDDFYGFAFRDSERYQCYKLTTVGSDDYLFGYVEIGSRVALQMEDLLERLRTSEKATEVELENTEDEELPGETRSDDDLVDKIELSQELLYEEPKAEAKPEAMILRLQFLQDDPSKRCVEIKALVAERWMYEESPEPVGE